MAEVVELSHWDLRYYRLAMHVAAWSKDPSTKVGSVLVGEDPERVALGYNGFPRGIADLPERLADREAKYRLTMHAERNVLDNAGFPAVGATMYSTQLPCSECAKSVVKRRVSRVVCPLRDLSEPWRSDGEWTRLLFRESGVALVESSELVDLS